MTRSFNPTASLLRRRWLVLGVVIASLAVAAGSGCNRDRRARSQPGGSTAPRAVKARKDAESYASAAVAGAAQAQAAAHPELVQQRGVSGWVAKLNPWHKPAPVSATVEVPPVQASGGPTEPPKPPKPPEPPKVVLTPDPAQTTPARPRPAARRPKGAVILRERIVTDIPYPTEAEAEEQALAMAAERIEQKLRQLDPPVEYRPTLNVVKNEYVRPETRLPRLPTPQEAEMIKEAGYTDRVYFEFVVEMTDDQVREIRTRDRVVYGMRVLGIVSAVALAGFMFLRLDEWSKGYLTSWLAFVAAALAGGVVAALVIV